MSRSRTAQAVLSLTVLLSGSLLASAGEQSTEKPIVRKPWGIDTRVPWTNSRVKGSPDPPAPYRTEEAFPNLKFDEPLAMGAVPGTNRFGIAERHGKIYTFENEPRVSEKRLLVDVGRTVYGLAFHPRYLENGWVFVTSVLDAKISLPKGSRISRFTVTDPKSFKADAGSERVILEWPCGGHNGGCIRFGPEGNLYLATGDGSGIADEFQTGQNFGDLLGSILRINVDTETSGTPYRIPADNPFVNVPTARPEVYSFGHRQVWKFSFDRKTGTMWGGEVGQDLWEMVYIIRKGGNYGWSVNEGSHPFRPERPRGPKKFAPTFGLAE
jgi:glucose/arabinose dehydrogenase